MPMDKSRYPPDWDAISLRIREREGWRCKHCGVPNRARIIRSSKRPALYIQLDEEHEVWTTPAGDWLRDDEIPAEFDLTIDDKTGKYINESTVILTVHHIGVAKSDGSAGDPHDKMDVRDENLVALCQRCHFIEDLPIHIVNARKSRTAKKHQQLIKAGNVPLLGEYGDD